MYAEWIFQRGVSFTNLLNYIPVAATVVTTFLSLVLARATLRLPGLLELAARRVGRRAVASIGRPGAGDGQHDRGQRHEPGARRPRHSRTNRRTPM